MSDERDQKKPNDNQLREMVRRLIRKGVRLGAKVAELEKIRDTLLNRTAEQQQEQDDQAGVVRELKEELKRIKLFLYGNPEDQKDSGLKGTVEWHSKLFGIGNLIQIIITSVITAALIYWFRLGG